MLNKKIVKSKDLSYMLTNLIIDKIAMNSIDIKTLDMALKYGYILECSDLLKIEHALKVWREQFNTNVMLGNFLEFVLFGDDISKDYIFHTLTKEDMKWIKEKNEGVGISPDEILTLVYTDEEAEERSKIAEEEDVFINGREGRITLNNLHERKPLKSDFFWNNRCFFIIDEGIKKTFVICKPKIFGERKKLKNTYGEKK